jgi:DNA invertase Pin-like site-specific DNA recombinase
VRLVGYLRVSRVAGREGESFISPDVQREAIAAYAKTHRHEIVAWREDLDRSGSRLDRPGLQEALDLCRTGEAAGIIAAKLDRLTRSIVALGRLIDQAKADGWNLIAVDLGLDLFTPNGKLVAHVLGAVAEWELDRRREGWDEAQERAVARGVHVASRTPTGYRRRGDGRLEPDPFSAPTVRELFRRRAAGAGWQELCAFMDAQGVSGPYGNTSWTPGVVRTIIGNRVYLGQARSGRHVNERAHEPIVSRAEWEAAQGVRAGVTPRKGDGLLLAGLVRCAGCRYILKADHMRDRDGTRLGLYRCRGRHSAGRCPSRANVLARVLDPWIEERFLEALGPGGPLAHATAATRDVETAAGRLEEAEAELSAYRDAELVSVIGRDSYRAGLEKRAAAVDRARAGLAEARRRSQLAGALPDTPGGLVQAWPGLSVAERRRILRAAIDTVVVRSVRGAGRQVPIGERVLILWRDQAPPDLPRRGRRGPLAPFPWPGERPHDAGVPVREDGQPLALDGGERRGGKTAHGTRPPSRTPARRARSSSQA